ncbi:Probable peptidyl-prolyl cis-trans isomerase [uncultured Clostridium sp.]|uniref:peptidylprolyl isomerase n=1 Tax=uncultured Clostridium sp. TaxID=59620 RepID=UPI00082224D0|nr:peptidylprolyl isomerase [uncultured Clostridium sp.]SCI86574.1 Probable peptidyl-prolyl cis-trans isomerase [uncultured Clostridium sp.]
MKKIKKIVISVLALVMTLAMVGCGSSNVETGDNNSGDSSTTQVERPENLPIATIKVKDFGTIEAELYPDKAHNTVNNFIELANSGFYDGLNFHRVVKGFMNQGGDPKGDGTGGPGYSIKGEFSGNGYEANDLKHTSGVLSMARAQNPDSAGSQFFIMAGDSPSLDGQYAAFGKVINGLDVVEAINNSEVEKNKSTGEKSTPVTTIIIEEVRVDTQGKDYPEAEKIK